MNIQELRQQVFVLEQTSPIPDLPRYAEDWNVLAAEFESMGRTAHAESCRRRFRHYRDLDLEGYARLLEPVTAVTAEVP